MKNFLAILILFSGFLPWISNAQQTGDSLRPGLVLSGGGAKGYAHIGVLEVLEKNGVFPQYISGTSIGAIIGAYYAAGYSPEQIKEIFTRMNFSEMLQDRLPRRYLPLYWKKTGRNLFFYFPVDKKKFSIHLPRGLTRYQMFYNRLFEDLYNIQYVKNFDSLPVRIRFYATDLVHGKSVEFKSGSVPQALVASSAFPSLVEPQKINGKLLSDGGILNNYPINGAIEMGAGYIIGVDIQGRLLKENEIRGIPDILDQITGFYMYANMPDKIRKTDLYIRPPVTDFSVTDFDALDTIYRLGKQTALQYRQKLLSIGRRQTRKPVKLIPHHPDSLRFTSIDIHCDENIDEAHILWQTNFETTKKISFDDFIDGINYLYGTGDYKHIYYYIKPDSTLVLNLVRDTTDLRFKFAYQYSPLYKINLLAGISYRNFIRKSGLLDIDFILGDPLRYNLEFLMDNGYHFGFGFSSSLHQFNRNVSYPLFFDYVSSPSFNQMDLHFSQWKNRVYFLTMLSTNLNFLVGAEWRYMEMFTTVFSGQNDNRKYFLAKDTYGGGFMELYYDDLNDFYFPASGISINFSTHYYIPVKTLDTLNPFYKFRFHVTAARKHGLHLSTSYQIHAGFISFGQKSPYYYFYPGGIEHKNPVDEMQAFYSRDYMDFKTLSYLLFQPQIQWQQGDHHLQLGIQSIVSEKNTGKRMAEFYHFYNIYLRYGLKSMFGPFFVTYAYEPLTGKNQINFTVGFFF
jgi:NTE family protein